MINIRENSLVTINGSSEHYSLVDIKNSVALVKDLDGKLIYTTGSQLTPVNILELVTDKTMEKRA